MPREGPVLVCSNHKSNFDPFLLGAVLPRKVFFMAKAELFRRQPLRFMMRHWGAFPIRRGAVDKAAIRFSLHLLQQSKVVLLFPGGTRRGGGDSESGGSAWRRGIAFLAVRARVPVVPVKIQGSYRLWCPLRVSFGRPIVPVEGISQRQAEHRLMEELLGCMRSLGS
nr:lysophospholipid acyltransferase family protein [Pasteuria penetrans]